MNLDEVGLKGTLERNDGLDKERVGVLEVQVHNTHHADTHQLAAELLAQLTVIVIHVGGGNGLGVLGATHLSRFDVLQGGHVCGRVSLGQCSTRSVRHTLLSIDFVLGVQGHSQNNDVRKDVASAHQHENLRILKGNLLGQLHHHQDDGEVGAASMVNFVIQERFKDAPWN